MINYSKLCVLIFVAGLSNPLLAADDWLANEVLTQLADIRRDAGDMEKQIQQLRVELDQLRAGVANQPGNRKVAALEVGDSIQLGQEDSAFAIVEFTDYQCPFCAKYSQNTFGRIKKEYIDTGKIKYLVKDYPLGFHQEAKTAAISARCANKQGAYWMMHSRLFENNGNLNQQIYGQLAEDIGLDLEQFTECMRDPEQEKLVTEDIALGARIGIQGTPAFLVGRLEDGQLTDIKAISGAQPYSSFARIIDSMVN